MNSACSDLNILNKNVMTKNKKIPLQYEVKEIYTLKMTMDKKPTPAEPTKRTRLTLSEDEEDVEPEAPAGNHQPFLGYAIPEKVSPLKSNVISDCYNDIMETSKSLRRFDASGKPEGKQFKFSCDAEKESDAGEKKRVRGSYRLHSLKIIPKCDHQIPVMQTSRVNEQRRTYGKNPSNQSTSSPREFVKVFIDEEDEENAAKSFEPENSTSTVVVKAENESLLNKLEPENPKCIELPPFIKPARMEGPKRTYGKRQRREPVRQSKAEVDVKVEYNPEEMNVFINDADQDILVKEEIDYFPND